MLLLIATLFLLAALLLGVGQWLFFVRIQKIAQFPWRSKWVGGIRKPTLFKGNYRAGIYWKVFTWQLTFGINR